jgi:hypothetical protein
MRGFAIAFCVFVGSSARGEVHSFFDASAEGWTALSEDLQTETPQFEDHAGDPGGFIRQPDFGTGSWFFIAPEAYLGDLSAYRGGVLSLSLRAEGTTAPSAETVDIVIEGSAGTLTLDLEADRTPVYAWSRESFRLTHFAAWVYSGPHVGLSLHEQIGLVLADVTGLRIRGDWGDGPDVGHLDSVVLEGPCNRADLSEPMGQLDFADVQRFLNMYTDRDPTGDVNRDGRWDFYDLQTFLNAYAGGCP